MFHVNAWGRPFAAAMTGAGLIMRESRVTQGRIIPWVELRLMGGDGEVQPWDGESTGEIEVRGPWIAGSYYADPSGDDKFDDGWLRTGDIGAVTPDGYVLITDRAKDLIKSGGEWISSVELETELMSTRR